MKKAAQQKANCAWPDGKDFIESLKAKKSFSDVWQKEALNLMLLKSTFCTWWKHSILTLHFPGSWLQTNEVYKYRRSEVLVLRQKF